MPSGPCKACEAEIQDGQRQGRAAQARINGFCKAHARVLAHSCWSAHCAKVSVEVDERRGVVSLLLQEGVLRREGVESTINAQGFRMLLPALTPKDVTDAMLGMVVRR